MVWSEVWQSIPETRTLRGEEVWRENTGPGLVGTKSWALGMPEAQAGVLGWDSCEERRADYWASRPAPTSLKSSSRLCCLRKSIFLTATSLPELRTVAIHTIPVEPSPILMKLSR